MFKKKKIPTIFYKILMEKHNCINGFAPHILFLKGLNEMKGSFFFFNP